MFGAVVVDRLQIVVGDVAQVSAERFSDADPVDACLLTDDRLNGLHMVRNQVCRHRRDIGRVLDDAAQAVGGRASGGISEGRSVALDIVRGTKQFVAR